MEFLDFFKEKLNIDIVIVLIVLAAGFFQEKYMCGFSLSKDTKHDASLKTLLMSFLASCVYIFLLYLQDKGSPIAWAQYFESYFFTTSLYEILVRPFKKWLLNKLGDNDQTPGA